MKKSTLYIFFFLSVAKFLPAQIPMGYSAEGFFQILPSTTTYTKVDYPILQLLLLDLLEDHLGYAFNGNNNTLPPLSSCLPIILNETLAVHDSENQWNIQESLQFVWACPTPYEEVPVAKLGKIEIDEQPPLTWDIYPNPSNGTLTFKWAVHQEISPSIMTISDWSGKVIKTINIKNQNQSGIRLDLSLQPSGVYFASLYRPHKTVETKRIILQ